MNVPKLFSGLNNLLLRPNELILLSKLRHMRDYMYYAVYLCNQSITSAVCSANLINFKSSLPNCKLDLFDSSSSVVCGGICKLCM